MKRRQFSWRRDRGAALVTVLTMLSLMAALAIVVVDAANMSLRRTANLVRMEQTRWYLMGGEAFAADALSGVSGRAGSGGFNADNWHGRSFRFPLDDGEMEVTIVDGSNCFNLNSVVSADGNGADHRVNPKGMFDLARLLDLIDARVTQVGLAAALVDWIDTDRSVTAGGAEDLGGGYVTANTLIGDVSELRNVRGFDETAMQRLTPFVCVRPTAAASLINPNTLSIEQAPLLAMLLPGLTVDAARQIIRERPAGGWRDIGAFLRHPTLTAMGLTEVASAQFSLQPRYFIVRVRVEREGASETSIALIDASGGGDGVVVRRVFGAGAPGQML